MGRSQQLERTTSGISHEAAVAHTAEERTSTAGRDRRGRWFPQWTCVVDRLVLLELGGQELLVDANDMARSFVDAEHP
jgi:hypothetical protein